jgi:hypothetical protein
LHEAIDEALKISVMEEKKTKKIKRNRDYNHNNDDDNDDKNMNNDDKNEKTKGQNYINKNKSSLKYRYTDNGPRHQQRRGLRSCGFALLSSFASLGTRRPSSALRIRHPDCL